MNINQHRKQNTRAILACISAGLFFFYTIFQKVTFNAISADLISKFHLSVTGLGGISSAYLYANALWLIPGGILLEKFSSRIVTLVFVFACAVSSFVFAKSSSVLLDIIMRFIGGLGSAMSLLISLRLAARWFPDHSARVIGLLVSLGMSAGIVANAPFSVLMQHVGYQNSLIYVGYFGLVIGTFMLFFLHDRADVDSKVEINFSSVCRDIKNVACNMQNWKSGVCIGLMNLPIFILASLWGNLYLMHTAGYTSDKATLVISMIFVGEITGAPIVGWISDKIQNRKFVLLMGSILSLMMTVFIMDAEMLSATTLSILFFLLGFFLSAQVIGYSVIAESNDASVSSTASGFGSSIVNLIGALCQVLFPLLLTLHFTAIGQSAYSYQTAFLMFPVAFLMSIALIYRMKKTEISSQKVSNDFHAMGVEHSEEKLLSHS